MPLTSFFAPACTALALLLALAAPQAHAGEPYTPASTNTVLIAVPPKAVRAAAIVPGDLPQAIARAREAIAEGRAEGDPRAYGRAEAALASWFRQANPPTEVRLLRAVLLQQRHQFAAALADLDAIIQQGGQTAQARLSRAALLLTTGQPSRSQADCAALAGAAPALIVTACSAAAVGQSGRLAEARAALAAEIAESANAAPDLRVWALTVLAELDEAAGDDAAAAQHYAAALALAPRDSYVLAARTDLALRTGRKADLPTVCAPLAALRAQDALLLRLALCAQALGDGAALDQDRAELQARFAQAEARGERYHRREQARMALELTRQPALALRYAQENWQSQREPADARLLLQAALTAGQPTAAEPARAWMRETAIEDVRLQSALGALDGGKP